MIVVNEGELGVDAGTQRDPVGTVFRRRQDEVAQREETGIEVDPSLSFHTEPSLQIIGRHFDFG